MRSEILLFRKIVFRKDTQLNDGVSDLTGSEAWIPGIFSQEQKKER